MERIDVVAKVVDCTECELHRNCTLPVPFRGDPGRIAVIGEAPGETEDREGRPFIGPAGQLLERHLRRAGLGTDLAFLNTVSCFPHGTPTWDHVRSCDGVKWTQLAFLKPNCVLLLGRIALRGMRPDLDLRYGRGRPFEHRGIVCFASYHPAAALRNGKYERVLRDDLKIFHDVAHSADWRAHIPDTCAGCENDAEWWEACGLGWCRQHLPEHERAAFDARQSLLAAELDAARRRDNALARVVAGADPDWMTQAWDALVDYLHTHPSFFVDTFWADTNLERPRESRALGPLVLKAARKGLMAKSGEFRKSAASNMTEKPVWRSLIYQPKETHA
jgi:uracil-DNA glycosylase